MSLRSVNILPPKGVILSPFLDFSIFFSNETSGNSVYESKKKLKNVILKWLKRNFKKISRFSSPFFFKIGGGGGNELSAQRNGFSFSPINNLSDLHFSGGVKGKTFLVIKHLR